MLITLTIIAQNKIHTCRIDWSTNLASQFQQIDDDIKQVKYFQSENEYEEEYAEIMNFSLVWRKKILVNLLWHVKELF